MQRRFASAERALLSQSPSTLGSTCAFFKVSKSGLRKALLKTEKERASEPERRGRKPIISKARVRAVACRSPLLDACDCLERGSVRLSVVVVLSLECSSVVDPLPSGQNGCFPQSKLRFLCAERRFPRLGSARDEGGAPHEVDGSCQLGGNHALVGEEQVQLAGLRDEREETHLQAHEVEVLLANPQAGRARGREGGGLWDTAT